MASSRLLRLVLALPQLRAATDPNARGGEFYGPRYINTGPPRRLPIMRRIGMRSAACSSSSAM